MAEVSTRKVQSFPFAREIGVLRGTRQGLRKSPPRGPLTDPPEDTNTVPYELKEAT